MTKTCTTNTPGGTQATADLAQNAWSLATFIERHAPVLVLTGAGISTASGIPEYRDADGNWKHAKPVQYRDFMESPDVYRRYWARSTIGWKSMGRAQPNTAHYALAELEQQGYVDHLITQNVDRLHEKARQKNLINLHGELSTVSCQTCAHQLLREELQHRMRQQNPAWFALHRTIDAGQKPDGDADIDDSIYESFFAPFCPHCGGKLKPDVVFFGETIPPCTMRATESVQRTARALLVVGSSLTVFSGFRIVRDFCQRELPVALLNRGKTRADELVKQKYIGDASRLLPLAAKKLQ